MGYGTYKGEFISFDGRDVKLKNIDGGYGGGDEDEIVYIPIMPRRYDESRTYDALAFGDFREGDLVEFDVSFETTLGGHYPMIRIAAEHQNTRALLERIEALEALVKEQSHE